MLDIMSLGICASYLELIHVVFVSLFWFGCLFEFVYWKVYYIFLFLLFNTSISM